MKIFFDTETTGVPKNYKAPVSDTDNWPRLVQLGFILVAKGEIIHSEEWIVKPDGFEIPKEASDIHGITTEIANAKGSNIGHVLKEFEYFLDASEADEVIGHNIAFDMNIVGAEFWRLQGRNPFEGKKSTCTMMSGIEFCGLPGKYPGKLKWPKLEELYFSLFLKDLPQTHTALDDIERTVECYNAMVERGIIKTT